MIWQGGHHTSPWMLAVFITVSPDCLLRDTNSACGTVDQRYVLYKYYALFLFNSIPSHHALNSGSFTPTMRDLVLLGVCMFRMVATVAEDLAIDVRGTKW